LIVVRVTGVRQDTIDWSQSIECPPQQGLETSPVGEHYIKQVIDRPHSIAIVGFRPGWIGWIRTFLD